MLPAMCMCVRACIRMCVCACVYVCVACERSASQAPATPWVFVCWVPRFGLLAGTIPSLFSLAHEQLNDGSVAMDTNDGFFKEGGWVLNVYICPLQIFRTLENVFIIFSAPPLNLNRGSRQ